MSTPQFTDRDKRDWPLALDFPDVSRIKKATELDLLAKDDLAKMSDDLSLLVDVMYVAWKPLADARELSDEDFGRLVSHCFEGAARAFNEALADFFLRVGRRPMAQMIRAAMELGTAQVQRIEEKLDPSTLRRLLTRSMQVTEKQLDLEIAKAEAEMDAILGSESSSSEPSSASTMSSPAAG